MGTLLPNGRYGVSGKRVPMRKTRQVLRLYFCTSISQAGAAADSLSHRLHSSTLDTLGLVAGLSSLCREFGARQGIEVDFASEDIPRTVRPEVSLCLFRIVQEGLQNMKKPSESEKLWRQIIPFFV